MRKPTVSLLLWHGFAPLVLAGCVASVTATPPRYSLDSDMRAKILDLMGDQYVEDLDTVYAAAQSRADLPYHERRDLYDPTPTVHCLEGVALGTGLERRGDVDKAAQAFHDCATTCKNERERPASPFKEIADRYAVICIAARLKQEAIDVHLVRFDKEEGKVDHATHPLNRHTAVSVLRGALRQAREGLPANDERLVSRERRLDSIVARYKAELDRVDTFLARDDVRTVRSQIDEARTVVETQAKTGTASQLRLANESLRQLEAKYSSLIEAAGF